MARLSNLCTKRQLFLAPLLFTGGLCSGLVFTRVPELRESYAPDAIMMTSGTDVERSNPPRSRATPPIANPSPRLNRRDVARHAQGWTVRVHAGEYYGAGVVIDARGFVLTNAHVVGDHDRVRVTPFGGESIWCEVLETDSDLDLALLHGDLDTSRVAPVTSIRNIGVGDDILAVGSPRKMHYTVSRGMVSFVGRSFKQVRYLQTDIPINVGNSGGPVVTMQGEVVGIMTFVLRDSQGLSFAIPIDYAFDRFSEHLASDAINLEAFALWSTDPKGS